jgi:hypothetical protein
MASAAVFIQDTAFNIADANKAAGGFGLLMAWFTTTTGIPALVAFSWQARGRQPMRVQ